MRKSGYILLIALLVISSVAAFEMQSKEVSVRDLLDKEKLKENLPTLETVEATLAEAQELDRSNRFLLYTKDGKNIMWGVFAEGHFKGQDNHGKTAWGIYGKTVFAGFYDGEFFWGRYSRGRWRAYGLFGLNYSGGRFVVFLHENPTITPAALK